MNQAEESLWHISQISVIQPSMTTLQLESSGSSQADSFLHSSFSVCIPHLQWVIISDKNHRSYQEQETMIRWLEVTIQVWKNKYVLLIHGSSVKALQFILLNSFWSIYSWVSQLYMKVFPKWRVSTYVALLKGPLRADESSPKANFSFLPGWQKLLEIPQIVALFQCNKNFTILSTAGACTIRLW